MGNIGTFERSGAFDDLKELVSTICSKINEHLSVSFGTDLMLLSPLSSLKRVRIPHEEAGMVTFPMEKSHFLHQEL